MVHVQKKKSFTHPHVVPNLYEFLSSSEHKRRYFYEVDGYRKLVTNILQNIFLIQQKKDTHTGLEQSE